MASTKDVIRDELTITANFPFLKGLGRGDLLRLVARNITLTEACNFNGVSVEFYAFKFQGCERCKDPEPRS